MPHMSRIGLVVSDPQTIITCILQIVPKPQRKGVCQEKRWSSYLTCNTSQDLLSTSFVSDTVIRTLCGFSCLILTYTHKTHRNSYTLQVSEPSFGDLKEHGQDHIGQVRIPMWAQGYLPTPSHQKQIRLLQVSFQSIWRRNQTLGCV